MPIDNQPWENAIEPTNEESDNPANPVAEHKSDHDKPQAEHQSNYDFSREATGLDGGFDDAQSGLRVGGRVNVEPNPQNRDHPATLPLLGWKDISSLIINKMVGTGIFTGPPMVLMYTQHKGEAFALWVVGFIITCCQYVFIVQLLINAAFQFGG